MCPNSSRVTAPNASKRNPAYPVWAEIPFDPRLGAATDSGTPLVITDPDAHSCRAIIALADRVEEQLGIRSEDTVEGVGP